MLGVKLEQFEGPLDLLLQLIEEEKLDITEVSLSRVADQYLQHLATFSDEHRIDELADFIVIAAKLLLIKSRALISEQSPEEEEEIEELQRQLKLYRAFVDASKKIDALYKKRLVAFPRRQTLMPRTRFIPPPSVAPQTLYDMFRRIIASIRTEMEKPREILFPVRVSIKEKIGHIVALLSRRVPFRFHDVLKGSASRADAVVSFMALLELIKQRTAHASQAGLFEDIVISHPTADQRGQTLIEVITALAVIAVGLVGALSLATSNVRNQGIGLSRLVAQNSAREGIEVVRNIRDSNWLSGHMTGTPSWYEGLSGSAPCAVIRDARAGELDFVDCPSGTDFFVEPFRLVKDETSGAFLQKGSAGSVSGTPLAFYRKLELVPICLTADKEAETLDSCAIANAIGVRVTSEVSWQQSGQNLTVRLRENLYNWR